MQRTNDIDKENIAHFFAFVKKKRLRYVRKLQRTSTMCQERGFIGGSSTPMSSPPCCETATFKVYFLDTQSSECTCTPDSPCKHCLDERYEGPILMCATCAGLTEYDFIQHIDETMSTRQDNECCGLGLVMYVSKNTTGQLKRIARYLICDEPSTHDLGKHLKLCDECFEMTKTEHFMKTSLEDKIRQLTK